MDAAEPPRAAEVAPAQAPVRVEAPETELGLGAFFMEGGATGGYMGLSPFLLDEMGESVSLRPALVLGDPSRAKSYLAAAHLDVCARPGQLHPRQPSPLVAFGVRCAAREVCT